MTAARSDITSAAPYTLLGSFLASRGEQSAQRAPKVTFRLHPRSCKLKRFCTWKAPFHAQTKKSVAVILEVAFSMHVGDLFVECGEKHRIHVFLYIYICIYIYIHICICIYIYIYIERV